MLKKSIVMLLMVAMVLSMFTACGGKKEPSNTSGEATKTPTGGNTDSSLTYKGNDVSKHETLTLYLLGDKSADFDKVYAKVNEILKSTVNVTLDVKFLSWSEHDTKYSLLFTSQEDFDLIFTAPGWAHYEDTVAMGGFEPLTEEFIKKYAPDIWDVVPAVAWEQVKISGMPYAVPSAEMNLRSDVNALRGDLLEQSGLKDITTIDELKQYFAFVSSKQSETGVSPLGNASGGMLYGYFYEENLKLMPGTPYEFLFYNYLEENNYDVEYLLDLPWFRQYCLDMKEYYEAGWWSKDSLASSDQRQDGLLRGTASSMSWNIGSVMPVAAQANKEHPEWNVTIVDPYLNFPKTPEAYSNNDTAINAFSKKKERAMMVLNEIYTNGEINRLVRYGIEGEHYKLVEDKFYEQTDLTSNFGIEGNCSWGWKNPNFSLAEYVANPTENDIRREEMMKVWETNVAPFHPLDMFSFDKTNLTSQIAMVDTLVAEYYTPLISGMAGDVDKAIAELRKQLDNAGMQDIIKEMRNQVEEYKKNQ